jgi:FAD:protein FMN transferase
MRCARRWSLGTGLCLLLASAAPRAEPLTLVHQQRFAMGTMFDIVVYHASRAEAERAIERAMAEIVRLDRVMSHFKADSDLSKLVRDARNRFVTVEPSLYEVLEESLVFSRRSGGKFDVTVAPLLRVWNEAHAKGRSPSAAEIADAQRCVGYEKIETSAPNRIRFHSDCLEIDLGGIGKGYAVDRALASLRNAGMRHALVNAGSSSIAAIGSPPGGNGWPVDLTAAPGSKVLLLRDNSMSTSQQSPSGGILDPESGTPIESELIVTVTAPSATESDALSTAVLLLSKEEGVKLLEQFPGVSALWMSEAGVTLASYHESRLQLSRAR